MIFLTVWRQPRINRSNANARTPTNSVNKLSPQTSPQIGRDCQKVSRLSQPGAEELQSG